MNIQLQNNIFAGLDISPQTKRDYEYRMPAFIKFAEAEGWGVNTFLKYKQSLAQRKDITVSTKNKYLVSAKVLCKEAHRLGMLPVDITANVKSFQQSRKHKVDGLNQEEVKAMAHFLKQLTPSPKISRLKALFALLTYQGMRQVEIVRLDVKDVNFANKTLSVQGKGKDDKEIIYMSPQTVAALNEYMKVAKVGDGALFKSLSNRKTDRISTMTIKREFQGYKNHNKTVLGLFDVVGVGKSVHGFRHFFTTTVLAKLHARDARKFSRHNSLDTLMIYDDELDVKEKSSVVFALFKDFAVA